MAEWGSAGPSRAAAVRARRARAERAQRAAAAQCRASRSRAVAGARRDRRPVPDEPCRQPCQSRAGAGVFHDLRPRVAVAGGLGRWTRWSGKAPGTPAPVMGAMLAALDVTAESARHLCLYGTVRGVLAAAVRLGIAGSYDAQRLQHDTTAAMLAVAERCRRARRARSRADGAAARSAAGVARSPLLAPVSVLKGLCPPAACGAAPLPPRHPATLSQSDARARSKEFFRHGGRIIVI